MDRNTNPNHSNNLKFNKHTQINKYNKEKLFSLEKELEDFHLLSLMASEDEDDDEFITIDMSRKTLKRMIRIYCDNDNDKIKKNKIIKFTQQEKSAMYEKFKLNFEIKDKNMKYEIEQILTDVYNQHNCHEVENIFKHYQKYVS